MGWHLLQRAVVMHTKHSSWSGKSNCCCFPLKVVYKQYIILNHVFCQCGSNLKPVTLLPFDFAYVPVTTSLISNYYCSIQSLEIKDCPPFREDMFGFVHNYTHPRPITREEIFEVIFSCYDRLYY